MKDAEVNRGEFYKHKQEFSILGIPRLSDWEKANKLWPVSKNRSRIFAGMRICRTKRDSISKYRNQDSVIRGRMTPNVLR